MSTLTKFLGFAFVLTVVLPHSGAQSEAPIGVSVIQLIASPEKFDGKLVAVTGFLTIGHAADLLYLSEEHYRHGLSANAVWFHLSEEMGRDRQKLTMNYVALVGVFRNSREGPYGCPNGGVATVVRYMLWSTTENPASDMERVPTRKRD